MAVSTHLKIALPEYDARIRTFIPDYEEMLDAAAASLVAAGRRDRRVVDLARERARWLTGWRRPPGIRLVGIDEDEGMLAMAARRLPPGAPR